MSLAPIHVVVTDMGSGARRVVLACSCVKVGRVISAWESLPEVIEQLKADHQRQSPACRHPEAKP
jgi:hypothetical protein